MKRDGRLLDHRTLETIRLMAVERVLDGERPSSVVASYGFNRTTIYRWLSAAATPGVGLRALHAKPATGRPRSLTSHQEKQVFRWIKWSRSASVWPELWIVDAVVGGRTD
jgi:transposase